MLTLRPFSLDRMGRGAEKVTQRLLRAAGVLEAAGVPYAVAGGNAVALWGSRVDEAGVRNTRGVGVLLRRGDFDAAKRALEDAGLVHPSAPICPTNVSWSPFSSRRTLSSARGPRPAGGSVRRGW